MWVLRQVDKLVCRRCIARLVVGNDGLKQTKQYLLLGNAFEIVRLFEWKLVCKYFHSFIHVIILVLIRLYVGMLKLAGNCGYLLLLIYFHRCIIILTQK